MKLGLRSSLATAGALGLIALLLRLPFRMRTLYSYDSANYAFALRDYYNVAHHHPHPPGYPLYVAAAKLIDLVVHDPNASLVLLSTVAAAGAVAATTLLAERQYGRRTALLAGLLLAVTVGFWGYSEVAYPYTSLAFWLATGALLCQAVLRGQAGLALPLGATLGVGAGFRWDAALFLAPLWAWALLQVGWWRRLASVVAFLAACLAWFVPMVWLSGGLASYLEALRLQSEYVVGTYSIVSGGRALLEFNLSYLVTFLRQMYGLNLLLVLYVLGRLFTPRRLATDWRIRFLLLWLLPALLVYFVIHIGEPGYVLSLAPAFALAGAVGLAELDDELRLSAHVLAARWPGANRSRALTRFGAAVVPLATLGLLLWHADAFLTGVGPGRLPELRLIDATQQAQLDYLRLHADPATSIILAHDRFRQTQYALPEYDVRLLFDEYAQGWREGRTWRIDPPLTATTLYVLDDLDVAGTPEASRARLVVLRDNPRVTLWEFDLRGVRAIAYGYRQVHLETCPGVRFC